MALYEFKCKEHGKFEDFGTFTEMGPPSSLCPACGDWCEKVPSVPVTDCYSFGKNGYANRTPEYARKSYYEEDERKRHALKRELGITSKLVPKG